MRKRVFAAAFAAIVGSATAIASAQEGHAPAGGHGGGHAAPEHGAPAHGAAAHGDEHGAAAHGGGHHGRPLNWADINWTDIFDKERPAVLALVINFGLLAGLYYTLGKKPVAEALKQRRVTIAKDIENAKKRLDEANERAKKYQADLKNADTDAETARTALVTAGKGEVERQLADAKEKAERMQRDAERLVQQERSQLEQDLHRETVERSVLEAMKVLERTVSPEDHARFAHDLLAELARHPGARKAGSVQPPQGGAS